MAGHRTLVNLAVHLLCNVIGRKVVLYGAISRISNLPLMIVQQLLYLWLFIHLFAAFIPSCNNYLLRDSVANSFG